MHRFIFICAAMLAGLMLGAGPSEIHETTIPETTIVIDTRSEDITAIIERMYSTCSLAVENLMMQGDSADYEVVESFLASNRAALEKHKDGLELRASAMLFYETEYGRPSYILKFVFKANLEPVWKQTKAVGAVEARKFIHGYFRENPNARRHQVGFVYRVDGPEHEKTEFMRAQGLSRANTVSTSALKQRSFSRAIETSGFEVSSIVFFHPR